MNFYQQYPERVEAFKKVPVFRKRVCSTLNKPIPSLSYNAESTNSIMD